MEPALLLDEAIVPFISSSLGLPESTPLLIQRMQTLPPQDWPIGKSKSKFYWPLLENMTTFQEMFIGL